jgi:hypothetical protein
VRAVWLAAAGATPRRALPRRAAEPASAERPASLDWDSTDFAARGGRLPVGDRHARLAARFERELAGGFSHAAAADAPSGVDELVVYISAADAAAGIELSIEL